MHDSGGGELTADGLRPGEHGDVAANDACSRRIAVEFIPAKGSCICRRMRKNKVWGNCCCSVLYLYVACIQASITIAHVSASCVSCGEKAYNAHDTFSLILCCAHLPTLSGVHTAIGAVLLESMLCQPSPHSLRCSHRYIGAVAHGSVGLHKATDCGATVALLVGTSGVNILGLGKLPASLTGSTATETK
eukprot:3793352-Pyramimonas_sp.AAC.2